MRVTHYAMTTNIAGAAVQAGCLALTVNVLDWGYYGICFSTAANFAARYLLTVYLVRFDKCVPLPAECQEVSFFSRDTITDLGD